MGGELGRSGRHRVRWNCNQDTLYFKSLFLIEGEKRKRNAWAPCKSPWRESSAGQFRLGMLLCGPWEQRGHPQYLGRRFNSKAVPAKVKNLMGNKMSTKKSTSSKTILQNKVKGPATWFGRHRLLSPSLTTWTSSSGPTWQKERTCSGSSLTSRHTHPNIRINKCSKKFFPKWS